jgi:hypothetical protein
MSACEIMQRQADHRPPALAGATRLRPQHAKARLGDTGGERVEVQRPAAARGQQHDKRARPLGDQVDAHVVIADDSARAFGGGRSACRQAKQDESQDYPI